MLIDQNSNDETLQQHLGLLRASREHGIEPVFYVKRSLRVGENIDIPVTHQAEVYKIGKLFYEAIHQADQLLPALEALEALIAQLEAGTLFHAALQRDLALRLKPLKQDHPKYDLERVLKLHQEALVVYRQVGRSVSIGYIQQDIGIALQALAQYEESLLALQETITAWRSNARFASDLAKVLNVYYAEALIQLQRMDEAEHAYNESLQLSPISAWYRNRAWYYIQVRRIDEAQRDLETAVQLDGHEDSPYLWQHRASIAIALGDGEKALSAIEETLKRDANHEIDALQAQALWLKGDLTDVRARMESALKNMNTAKKATFKREIEQLLAQHPTREDGDILLGAF